MAEHFRIRSPLASNNLFGLKMWLVKLLYWWRGFSNIKAITASVQLTTDDYLIIIDEANASANVVITLPPLSTCHTKQFHFLKISEHATHTTTIQANGTDIIYVNGASVIINLPAVGGNAHVINTEQVWFIL